MSDIESQVQQLVQTLKSMNMADIEAQAPPKSKRKVRRTASVKTSSVKSSVKILLTVGIMIMEIYVCYFISNHFSASDKINYDAFRCDSEIHVADGLYANMCNNKIGLIRMSAANNQSVEHMNISDVEWLALSHMLR